MPHLRLSRLVAVALLSVACSDEVTVVVDPTSASLLPGESVTFTATVTGTDDTSVTWSVKNGPAGGTVTEAGVYTAPARSGRYQVVATSVADPAKSATATVTVATSSVLLTGTAPASPSNDNNPIVQGTAESGAAVTLFGGDDCNGVPLGSGVAGVDGRFEIAVTVPSDTATTFRARVTSAGGVSSDCSASSLVYVEDSTPPTTAIVFGTSATSPGKQRDIAIEGTSEPLAVVRAFLDGACEGESAGAGTADESGGFAVAVRAPANVSARFYVRPQDGAGNIGPCSLTSAVYVHDDIAPAQATFVSTDPASPSNENTVVVFGTAEAGATVALYDGSACLLKLGEGTAEDFATDGISTTVQDDRLTRFHAIVTDAAGNASGCSAASIDYLEDSTVEPPALAILTPASPSRERTINLVGTAEELATVELYGAADCAGTAVSTTAASAAGSFEFTLEASVNTTSTWSARTIDLASNVSGCSEAVSFTHDDEPPAAPRVLAVSPASPAANTTPTISGTAETASRVRLYATSSCTGAVVAEGAAIGGQFSFEVTVEEDSTTRFHATATDAAGNVSACSPTFVTYVEQSSAVVSLSLQPSSITLAPGAGTVFVAEVTGTTNTGVEWAVGEEDGGTISSDGAYVAPDAAGTFHVVATSVANRSVTATAVVTVVDDAPSITVQPAFATTFVGQLISFTATGVRFDGDIVWEVSTPEGGRITPDGEYEAPPEPGRYVVVARSEDGAVRGTAVVDVKLPEISGTVQAPPGMTGRVFISVRETGPQARWEPVAGTSLEAPGAFTVRGLPRMGTYLVEATMPASGLLHEATLLDPSASIAVDLTEGPADDVTLVLEPGDDDARPAPMLAVLVQGDSALALVEAATDGQNGRWTNVHRIYVATGQPATAENAFFSLDLTGSHPVAVLPTLEAGTEYFATAVGLYDGEPGLAAEFGPFGVAEAADGFTISGQVHVEGDLPAGEILVVAVSDGPPIFVRAAGTSSPLDYALPGMPSGTHQIGVLADLDGDGVLQAHETLLAEKTVRSVVIADSDVTGADLFARFDAPSSKLSVSTFAWYATEGDHYQVRLQTESGATSLVRASLISGPHAGLPYDMAPWSEGGQPGFSLSLSSSRPPVLGTGYTVEAVDAHGETHHLSGMIERVIEPPAATSPLSVETDMTPSFAWTTSQSLPEGSTWSLWVSGIEGHLWGAWDLPISQRSVAWNFDGRAEAETLLPGRDYRWTLEVRDPDGNRAEISYDFTTPLALAVFPTSLTLAPGGAQTLWGEVLGSPGEDVVFSVEPGHGSIDSLGHYTAPMTPGSYEVTARAARHPDVITTIPVTVIDAPQVVVTAAPQQVSVAPGAQVQLNAVVEGSTDHRLTWRLLGGDGAVDESGIFTAAWSPGTHVVAATSVADPSKAAVFFVTTRNDLSTLVLSTTNVRVALEGTATITATTDGGAVAWRALDAGVTVADGVVEAGRVPGRYRVVASLADDPTVTATATVVVAHPDVSGHVSFEGVTTGPIVVQLYATADDFPLAGTVADASGNFVIRGVQRRGPARLVAWMDSSGVLAQKSSDPRVEQVIEMTPESLTGLSLLLETPTPVLPASPRLDVVAPGASSALVVFSPSTNADDSPGADSHRVLVSRDAAPDESNSIVVAVPAGRENVVLVSSLTDGDDYYFRVAADAPGGTSWSDIYGPVTIGAQVEGTTVSGVVESQTALSGPLLVALVGENVRIDRIEAPTASQAFHITGVPAGTYEIYVLRDHNDNGTFEVGEISPGETIEVLDQPVVDVVLTQADESFRASVSTRVNESEAGTHYGLIFRIAQGSRPILSVSIVDGAEFPVGADIGFQAHGADKDFVGDFSRDNRAPRVGETFTLLITYLDGGQEETTVEVARLWTSAPRIVSPVAVADASPNFTWAAPEEPASSTFTYYVGVSSPSGGVWWTKRLPSSQTSIAWNADGNASVSSLTVGESYVWFVVLEDELGNMAQSSSTFTVE